MMSSCLPPRRWWTGSRPWWRRTTPWCRARPTLSTRSHTSLRPHPRSPPKPNHRTNSESLARMRKPCVDHGPNIYKDTKPWMSAFLKNWVKVLGGRCLSDWGPWSPSPAPPVTHCINTCTSVIIHTGKRGGGRWTSEKVRGVENTNMTTCLSSL